MGYVKWALQDLNTSRFPSGKPQTPGAGVPKSVPFRPDSGPVDASEAGGAAAGKATPGTSPEAAAGGLTGDALAKAIATLAQLPLSDAERAEAVRRLLAERPAPPTTETT